MGAGEDVGAVLRVMRDGNVSTHPVIHELEEDFRAFTGRCHTLAHCNYPFICGSFLHQR